MNEIAVDAFGADNLYEFVLKLATLVLLGFLAWLASRSRL